MDLLIQKKYFALEYLLIGRLLMIYYRSIFRSEHIVDYLIHLYEKFLDLVAEETTLVGLPKNGQELIPPLEIEAIWLSHAIRTTEYRDDCLRLHGKVLHRSLNGDRYNTDNPGLKVTAQKWLEKYNTSLDYDLGNNNGNTLEHRISLKAGDVIKDNDWLREFRSNYYYDPDETPCNSISEYLHYAHLAKKYNHIPEYIGKIHATYRIDLAWHVHMLNTYAYEHFCSEYYGYFLHHSPWPLYDENKQLEVCDFTSNLWKDEFCSDLVRKDK